MSGIRRVGGIGTDRELAKYVQFLKEENKILRARIYASRHVSTATATRCRRNAGDANVERRSLANGNENASAEKQGD